MGSGINTVGHFNNVRAFLNMGHI